MYEFAIRRTRAADADAAGESGIRRRGDDVEPPTVSVVRGRLARTVESTTSGDTPSVADVQPENAAKETTAIAPSGRRAGVTMRRWKAASAPRGAILRSD